MSRWLRKLARGIAPGALLLGCSGNPPANWPTGGAALDIPKARWVFGTSTIDVTPDGKILINGEPELFVDRAGRVYDEDSQPIALLEPDGRLIGPDDEPLGIVGAMHASRAGEEYAWLTVAPSGEVIYYDEEAERRPAGVWIGCNGSASAHQTCMLVTHLLVMRMRAAAMQAGGPSVGLGIGIGIPIR